MQLSFERKSCNPGFITEHHNSVEGETKSARKIAFELSSLSYHLDKSLFYGK